MHLLTPPHIRELSIFSEMPTHFRKVGVRTAWADANKGGECIHSFLEGPVLDASGNLYVTDIPYGRIFKITPKGDWSLVTEYDGEPNGMKFLNARTLLITDYQNGLMTLDVVSGAVSPLLARRNTESFKGVNDLFIAKNGDIYFTDQGQTGLHDASGRVYRYTPPTTNTAGKLDVLLNNVPSPNGIALSPDEKVLFVACTRGNCVWRGPLQADGSVSKVGQFFTSYGPSGPDGLAVDAQGRLYVANPGLGYVWILNHRGEPETVWHAPKVDGKLASVSLTNLVLSADHKTMCCTDSSNGRILVGQTTMDSL